MAITNAAYSKKRISFGAQSLGASDADGSIYPHYQADRTVERGHYPRFYTLSALNYLLMHLGVIVADHCPSPWQRNGCMDIGIAPPLVAAFAALLSPRHLLVAVATTSSQVMHPTDRCGLLELTSNIGASCRKKCLSFFDSDTLAPSLF